MEIQPQSLFVSIGVVAVSLLIVALVILAVRSLARRPGVLVPEPDAASAKDLIAVLDRRLLLAVAVWAGSALFVTSGMWTPPSLAIPVYIVGMAIAGYALLAHTVMGRALLAEMPQRWLIGAQVYRVVGGLFLIAASYGEVPAYFAIPAGWGDIVVGLSAVLVAVLWVTGSGAARSAAWVWNAVGLLDLVVAVGIGSSMLARPAAAIWGGSPYWLERAAAGFQPLGPSIFDISFPLALIPTLIVPLSILLHLLSLRGLIALPPAEEAELRNVGARPVHQHVPSAPAA